MFGNEFCSRKKLFNILRIEKQGLAVSSCQVTGCNFVMGPIRNIQILKYSIIVIGPLCNIQTFLDCLVLFHVSTLSRNQNLV